MPTYLYEHTIPKDLSSAICEYDHEFEYNQSIHDNRLKRCPSCQMPVKRLIAGGVSVNWKGQGPPTPNFHG